MRWPRCHFCSHYHLRAPIAHWMIAFYNGYDNKLGTHYLWRPACNSCVTPWKVKGWSVKPITVVMPKKVDNAKVG